MSLASPQDPPAEAAPAAITGLEAFLEQVSQRRTLLQLGIGQEVEASIVADALDDAAMDNSPRLPSADEIAGILAEVRG